MKCLFIGICQLEAVAKILLTVPTFASIYQDYKIYTIFTLEPTEMERILNEEVPKADLVISQPVSKYYKNNPIFSSVVLRNKISKGAKHLIMANCYFTGYDPCPFQSTNLNKEIIIKDGMSYFPSLSLEQILDGDIQEACKRWCALDAYTIDELNRNIENTLTELKSREQKIFEEDFPADIIISDFITNNYKKKYLFHTYNHPTNELLYELVIRILDRLYISHGKIEYPRELLGEISIPPAPGVYFNTKMNFEYPMIVFGGKKYTTKLFMMHCVEILKTTPDELRSQWLDTIKYSRSKLK